MKLKDYPSVTCYSCQKTSMKPRQWALKGTDGEIYEGYGVWYYCKGCRTWSLKSPNEITESCLPALIIPRKTGNEK